MKSRINVKKRQHKHKQITTHI